MEELTYHKLLNLRKRFDKYSGETRDKIVSTIEACIAEEKARSDQRKTEKRTEYRNQKIVCEVCGKEMSRNNVYKHRRIHEHQDQTTNEILGVSDLTSITQLQT